MGRDRAGMLRLLPAINGCGFCRGLQPLHGAEPCRSQLRRATSAGWVQQGHLPCPSSALGAAQLGWGRGRWSALVNPVSDS